jgi:CheY-like chemotaxis protein
MFVFCGIHRHHHHIVARTCRHTKQGTVSLSVSVPGDLAVLGDIVRWRQLLINLMSNALKFTDAGSVCLNIERIQTDNGPALLVEVTDTGHGIPKEMMPALFHKYSQGGFHTGSGLGLIIAKQIVGLMGADLRVESPWMHHTEGSTPGTRFSFQVAPDLVVRPSAGGGGGAVGASVSVGGAAVAFAPSSTAGPATSLDPPRILQDRLTVLVVEDDMLNSTIMKAKVTQAARPLFRTVCIEVCINGELALQKYNELQNSATSPMVVDWILMDEHMESSGGVLTGSQTTRRLREAGCKAIICACSGNCLQADIEHYKAAGSGKLHAGLACASRLA